MNVYVVTYTNWEETYVDSIWSTYKKASDHIKKAYGESSRYDINEWRVDNSFKASVEKTKKVWKQGELK